MYELTLTSMQMQTLADMCCKVGGCPETSNRKYADELYDLVRKKGFSFISENFKGTLEAKKPIFKHDLQYVLSHPGCYTDGNFKYISVDKALFKMITKNKLQKVDLVKFLTPIFFGKINTNEVLK